MRKLRFIQVQAVTHWYGGRPQHTVERPPTGAFDVVTLILLHGGARFSREHRADAPELLEHDGLSYSLRAGPRTPQPTDHAWEPVAVYAPDDFSEEEFQDMYASARPQVAELNLHY
jgi:hypothetical protein